MSSIRDFFPIENNINGVKSKKNFIQENKKYVTKLAKSSQASKDNDNPSYKLCRNNTQKSKEKHCLNMNCIPENSKKFSLDKIDASIKSIRTAIAQTRIVQEKLGIKNHEKECFTLRDQATQTVNPYDEENILKNSIIKYSSIAKQIQKTQCVQTESSKPKNTTDLIPKKNLKKSRLHDHKSVTKHSHLVKLKENVTSCHQPGEIPEYLKNQKALKEKNENEAKKKLAIRHELGLDDPACPPGHVLIPEPERLDHLAKLKKEYNRLIIQLNMLPLSSDSYKMMEKRKHLEKELDELQLGLKLFSRNKLFVSVNPKVINLYK